MYVDHAATTPVRPEVLAAMLPYFSQEWGNPSSLYGPGRRAAHAVAHARDTVAEVDQCGEIDLKHLERSITDQTAIVSVMYANNEVGTIQPLREVVRMAHARNVPVHTDAVQAAAHLPLDVETLGVDLLSIAAHSFYGPKGVSALYVRRGARMLPQTQGGGQESGRRSGTENVPSVVGLAEALALAQAEHGTTSAACGRWQVAS